jgi:hypothetical protein
MLVDGDMVGMDEGFEVRFCVEVGLSVEGARAKGDSMVAIIYGGVGMLVHGILV